MNRHGTAVVLAIAGSLLWSAGCDFFYQTRLELRPQSSGAQSDEATAQSPEVVEFIELVDSLATTHGMAKQDDVWPPVYWDEFDNIHLELVVTGGAVRAVIWQIKGSRRGSTRRYKELRELLMRELRERYGERVEVLRQW